MHPITTLLLLSIPSVIVAENFKFTSPSTDTSLNLSAPIHITWDQGIDNYAQLDLKWAGETASGAGFSYTLEENFTTTIGQYQWDPANVSAALMSTDIKLSSGKKFTFEAKMHDANSSRGASVESDEYAVTGYPKIGNTATTAQPRIAMVALTCFLVLAVWWY